MLVWGEDGGLLSPNAQLLRNEVEVLITKYVKKTISKFPEVIKRAINLPAIEHLFSKPEERILLVETEQQPLTQ